MPRHTRPSHSGAFGSVNNDFPCNVPHGTRAREGHRPTSNLTAYSHRSSKHPVYRPRPIADAPNKAALQYHRCLVLGDSHIARLSQAMQRALDHAQLVHPYAPLNSISRGNSELTKPKLSRMELVAEQSAKWLMVIYICSPPVPLR